MALRSLAQLLASEPALVEAALGCGTLQLLSASVLARHPSGQPLALKEPAARLLALLALRPAGAARSAAAPAAGWLEAVLAEDAASASAGHRPCTQQRKLASHARRAQLNAASVGGGEGGGGGGGGPRFGDGMYLFRPSDPGLDGVGAEADVVFIHGLRGGPFDTWRCELAESPPPIWPADWLAPDLAGPENGGHIVRLLSLSYRTRYSDWEGATLGLQSLADDVLEKLTAAGCGDRPLALVGHSLGGVLIKLLLQRAEAEPRHARIAASLRAAAFYATPHFGSALAGLGSWAPLRPARAVEGLGPGSRERLGALNEGLKRLHSERGGGLAVLSFSEGLPTQLAALPLGPLQRPDRPPPAIAALVVTAESATPGFGEALHLHHKNHITVCKPSSREDEAYARTLALIRGMLAARGGEAGGCDASHDTSA